MSLHPSHIAIGANEYVETLGLELDAIEPGLVIEHRPGFAFSLAEARYRSALAGDHAPVAVDPAFAALAGGGAPAIAQTWVLTAVVAATTRAFGRVVANLAWENVRFPGPVADGDFVLVTSTILGKRNSASRPEQGILHVRTIAVTRGGTKVCSFERRLLVYRGASAPHRAAGYA